MDPPLFQWRTFCGTLVIVVAVLAVFWRLSPPRYLTNDDIAIRLGIEGTAVPGQPPTGFVLMTHAALGWVMVLLHRWMPTAPIWDLVVAGTLAWAMAVLFAIALNAFGTGWLGRTTVLAALLVGTAPLIAGMQFTIAATLAGGAAVLLAMTELASRQRRTSVLATSGSLLVVGALVRPMGSAAGAIAVGLCLLPAAACGTRGWRARLTHLAAILGIVVVVVGSLMYLDALVYRIDRDWNADYRYTWMVARLVEWGGELPSAEIDAIRASVGWTANDWAMLQRWLAVDPGIHGFDKVGVAYETRAALLGPGEGLRWTAQRMGAVDRTTFSGLASDAMYFLIVAIALAVTHTRGRGVLATLAVGLLFAGFCIAIQVVFKDLPFRLFAPLLACAMTSTVVVIGTFRGAARPVLSIVGLAVIVTVLARQGGMIAATSMAERRTTAEVERDVLELRQRGPSLIVLHADAFPSEYWWRPFVRPAALLNAIHVRGTDQNPPLQRFLSDTGRQPLFRAICDDPSIVVISEADRLDLITIYLREHFNSTVRWNLVQDGSFRAWRCTTLTKAG